MALKRLKSQIVDDLAMLELQAGNSSQNAELMEQPVLKSCPPNVDTDGVSQNCSMSEISPLLWLSCQLRKKQKQSHSQSISHIRTIAALPNDEQGRSGTLAQTQSQASKSESAGALAQPQSQESICCNEIADADAETKTLEDLLGEGPWE